MERRIVLVRVSGLGVAKWVDGEMGPYESVLSIAKSVIVEPGFRYRMVGQ